MLLPFQYPCPSVASSYNASFCVHRPQFENLFNIAFGLENLSHAITYWEADSATLTSVGLDHHSACSAWQGSKVLTFLTLYSNCDPFSCGRRDSGYFPCAPLDPCGQVCGGRCGEGRALGPSHLVDNQSSWPGMQKGGVRCSLKGVEITSFSPSTSSEEQGRNGACLSHSSFSWAVGWCSYSQSLSQGRCLNYTLTHQVVAHIAGSPLCVKMTQCCISEPVH